MRPSLRLTISVTDHKTNELRNLFPKQRSEIIFTALFPSKKVQISSFRYVVRVEVPSKYYKDYKIYCCFALNRMVAELGIDLYQDDLVRKHDSILKERNFGISKEEIKHEIKSNHYMTDKVVDKLVQDGFAQIEKEGNRYSIKITKEGILHVRKYNEFYRQIYKEQIRDHYRYRGLPYWFR